MKVPSIIVILIWLFSAVSTILFFRFSDIIGCYLENAKTPDILFYSSGIITLASIFVLLFLLWIKKDILPEELKEEQRKRLLIEEKDKRDKAHELEIAKLKKVSNEQELTEAFKEKYAKLNELLKNLKKEIDK